MKSMHSARGRVTRASAPWRTIAATAFALAAVGVLGGCGSGDKSTSSDNQSAAAKTGGSADRCKRNTDAGTINFISPFGYDASASIMDVFMAQKLGYFKQLCLDVKVNAASFTGQQLVSSGRAQFTGVGSGADALLTKASGANMTAIATYGDTDPHVILTNSKITNLKQLEGGTLGYFTNIHPSALAMLQAAGADVKKIKLIKLTNYDPTVVTRGQLDGLVGYASNQGAALKMSGLPHHAFYPADFGLKGTYNIMLVNTNWLQQHRETAADFMRADLKAVAYCLAHKTECVDYISELAAKNNQGAAFPKKLQLAVWNVESKFIEDAPPPIAAQSPDEWDNDYELVKRYGHQTGLPQGTEIPKPSSMLDTTLVAGLYRNNELIWPGP